MSDYITVKRGRGEALGIYFVSGDNYCPTYEELYYFKQNEYGENCVKIAVFLWAKDGKKIDQTIFEAVETPEVKAFFNGIKYY